MDRKKLLAFCVATISLVGIALASVPFLGSMNPNAKAKAALSRFDVSQLAVGELRILDSDFDYEHYNDWIIKTVVMRLSQDEVRAWTFPVKNGQVGMPDLHWYRPFYSCEQFGPTVVGGQVYPPIKCHDTNMPSDWWSEQWQWGLDGKNIVGSVDDFENSKNSIEGNYLVY